MAEDTRPAPRGKACRSASSACHLEAGETAQSGGERCSPGNAPEPARRARILAAVVSGAQATVHSGTGSLRRMRKSGL
jgi:hypothetical protein